jgi:hypothetical protein
MNFGLGQRLAHLAANLIDVVAQGGRPLEFQFLGRSQHLGV